MIGHDVFEKDKVGADNEVKDNARKIWISIQYIFEKVKNIYLKKNWRNHDSKHLHCAWFVSANVNY